MSRHAFTLLELLVVLAIIVTTLAVLAPMADHALAATRRVTCAANEKAWGRG